MQEPDVQFRIEGAAGSCLMVKPALIARVEAWLDEHGIYCRTDEGAVSDARTDAERVGVIHFGVAAHPRDLLAPLRVMRDELGVSLVEPDGEDYLRDHPPIHVDASGVARVARTRVTLDSIVGSFQRGGTAEQIADEYPAVSLPAIYAVLAFYLAHREQVDREINHRRAQADEQRRRWAARPEYAAMRERLLASRPAAT